MMNRPILPLNAYTSGQVELLLALTQNRNIDSVVGLEVIIKHGRVSLLSRVFPSPHRDNDDIGAS